MVSVWFSHLKVVKSTQFSSYLRFSTTSLGPGRISEVSDSLTWLRTSLSTLQSWASCCAKIGGSQLRTIFQCTKIEDCKSFSLRRRFVAKIENMISPDHVFIRTKKSCEIMPITPLFWPKTFPGGSKNGSKLFSAIFINCWLNLWANYFKPKN